MAVVRRRLPRSFAALRVAAARRCGGDAGYVFFVFKKGWKMNSMILTVGELKRSGKFPFQVKALFHFSNYLGNTPTLMRHRNDLEISIRTDSEAELCRDIINGEEQAQPFPNVAYKLPLGLYRIRNEKPRESIAFVYPAEALPELRRLGLIPSVSCRSFIMTAELKRLIAEFNHLSVNLYTPGTPELLDWTCFRILGELMFSGLRNSGEEEPKETVIRNISTWLRVHYAEDIFIDDVAAAYGLSHSHFFREWKKVFDISPLQFILDLRLEAAAWHLANSALPVSRIVKEVNFSGTTKFYRRFQNRYGMTPEAYRRNSMRAGEPHSEL